MVSDDQILGCSSVGISDENAVLRSVQFIVLQYATFFLYSKKEIFIVSQYLMKVTTSGREETFTLEDGGALIVLADAVVIISATMVIILVIVFIVII